MAVEYIGNGNPEGSCFGLTSSEKISFYGATPAVQRSSASGAAVATSVAVSSSSDAGIWGFSSSTQANAIVTLVNELRATLVANGLHKGSA